MKSKPAATRRKSAPRKKSSSRKAVRVHIAGRVVSYFIGKKAFWKPHASRILASVSKAVR